MNYARSIGNLIVEKQETVVKYLEKLEKWSKVNLVYKDMLRDRPDQWSYYVGYLDSVFKLIETCWNPGETENESSLSVDDTAKKADGFLCYQRDNNDKCRGPFLARMELQKRLLETDQDCQQEIFKQLVDYYVKFGSRNSCFRDICAYLDLLSREQRDDFVRIIKENVDLLGDEASNDDKVKALQRQICIECIEMRLGCHENLGSEERLAKAKYLMQLHKDHLELGSHLLPTDIQPVDILALLAAHLLLRSRELRESEDNDPVWHILLILEEASGHSPSNHEFKLLLMDVYCSLGVFGPAMKMAEELEMKYIMLDTLGYKVTRYAQPFCHYQSARSFFETTMRFFTSSQKETSEQIVAAYKYGTFRKIPEIKEFKDRLNYSIQYSLVVFERMHLEILRQANTCEEAKNLLKESDLLAECPGSANHFTTLVDNRDFEVLTYFDVPSRQLNKSQKSHSFSQEVLWIRYRCLGLRLLGIANSMTSCSPENGDKDGAPSSGGYDDLVSTTGELQDVIEKASGCVDKESEILNRSIYQPPISRWNIYLAGKYQEPIVIMTNILKSFSNAGTDNFVNSDDEIQKQIETLAVWFKDSIAKCKDNLVLLNADAKTINGPSIEHIGLIAETCNYVTIVLSLLLEPLRSRVKKPRKKKGHAAPKCLLVETETDPDPDVLDTYRDKNVQKPRRHIVGVASELANQKGRVACAVSIILNRSLRAHRLTTAKTRLFVWPNK
eukprot:gene13848-15297_t